MKSMVERRQSLAGRVRELRIERHGCTEVALALMAAELDLPASTWQNFERGVVMPAEILILLIERTHVSAQWLLTGSGPRFTADLMTRFLNKH